MKKKILIALLATVMSVSAVFSAGTASVFAADTSSSAEWVSGTTYQGGDVVTYKGKTYKCSWWTNNDIPGASEWGPWKEVEGEVTDPIVTDPIVTDPIVTDPIVTDPIVTDPIVTDPIVTDPIVTDPIVTDPIVTEPSGGIEEWQSGKAYPQGSQVTYNGKTYEAKWWTTEIPGTSQWGAWKEIEAPIDPNNTVPVINGVSDKTLEYGSTFNPMEGITATDAEDGDLTASIVVNGTVNTSVAGKYTLEYSVTDKGGATAKVAAVITVKAEEIDVPEGEYSQTVNVNGVKYPADYWNRKVVGYFPNYALNSENHANFSITDLQWDKLTHVQYAFAIADEKTMKLVPCDPENDVESKFEGRTFTHKGKEIKMDDTLGYYGQFNLMHTMQEMYPDVTVLVSTGGWAASRTLWEVCDNEANMRVFATSAVDFVRKYGFDGIDIDFEFPSETSQSGNPADFDLSETRRKGIGERYGKFIKILRDEFDKAAKEDGTYYWVTSAVSASSWVLGGQKTTDYLDYLDFVSVMSYDYHGGWNQFVENQANIYPDPSDTETASLKVPTLGFDWSYKYYRGAVQSEKILMGVPYYTRGWTNVNGGTNGLHGSSKTPATGIDNIWHDLDENGNEVAAGANPLWHVLNLMNEEGSSYKKYWDPVGCVPYVWNNVTKTFLTFEDEQSIQERINYVESHNLGGVLIWVMHGDYDYDAAQDKYVVGDTLTTMLYDQFKKMGPAKLTSDIDITNDVLDFDVDFGGTYDHPNYVYDIKITCAQELDKNFTFSFDLPNSCVFGGSWGGATVTTAPSKIDGFTTVTFKASNWQNFPANTPINFTGSIVLNFSAAKNFKLNGMSMKSEVENEIARLYRN